MSLNYNLIDTLKLLINSLNYNIFRVLIFIIFIIIYIFVKKNNSKIKYIITITNIVILILISLYYMKDILTFNFSNPINNIYFYFFNTSIYLIVYTISIYKIKYKNIYYVLYGIILINILFSLFMTYYLKCNTLLVLGNIFPMIKIGNVTSIIYYVFLTLTIMRAIIKKNFKGVK